VQSERLLDKLGIHYDPNEKYKSVSGRILPNPEKPQYLRV
jgi:hypothetical protein